MLTWVASQPTPVIALVLFPFAFLLAAAVLWGTASLAGRGSAADLKAVSPVTLTPLAAVFAFLVFLLASNVWGNAQRASQHVAEEAGALRKAVLLAEAMPADIRAELEAAIRRHIETVVADEWPAMAAGRAGIEQLPHALLAAMTRLVGASYQPSGLRLAQQHGLEALEQALAARRQRILLSQARTEWLQWLVIIVLDLLILVTLAMVHVDRRRTQVITMAVWSTAVATCLVVIMAFDRPYGGDQISVSPQALLAVLPK